MSAKRRSSIAGRYLVPQWPAPENIQARVSTRLGQESLGSYAGFNIATHVGDDPVHVRRCRTLLAQELGWRKSAQWLDQVHGIELVEARSDERVRRADGCFSQDVAQPCVVMTADCLPVLLTCRDGRQVAAVHAGWRGLCAGILEAALAAFSVPAKEVLVWLGPAIGAQAFEVGPEVRAAFIAQQPEAVCAFSPSLQEGHWMADLYLLARLRLQRSGCDGVYGGDFCTYSETDLFYSYRRHSVTGRQASMIWRTA